MAASLYMMPESPVFLLSKGRDKAAIKSLQWLRGEEYDTSEEIEQAKLTMTMDYEPQFINFATVDEGKCREEVLAWKHHTEGALDKTRVPEANPDPNGPHGLQADDRNQLRHLLPQ